MPDLGEAALSSYVELTANRATNTDITSGDTTSTPIILAKWELTQPVTPKQKIRFVNGALNCLTRRTSGAGGIEFGFITSTDDTIYDDAFFRIQGSNSVEQALSAGGSQTFINDDRLFFAILMYNTNGSTFGTIRNAIATVTLQLPPQYTLKRLV